jgi:hypothetical protein
MKKPLFVLVMLCLILNVVPDSSKATEGPQFLQKHISKEKFKEALIQRLTGPIGFIVGGDWFRGNEKILEIRKVEGQIDILYVTVQVVGFQGPHTPPYIEDIITFKLEGFKLKPIDYFNRVIPEKQWHKFQLE